MGTIANKLAKLKTTKAEIKAALEEAGQSVGDVFDTYPAAIRAVVSSGAKIATGSYVGTGKYGSSNPNSLTFDFEPSCVIIRARGTNSTTYPQTYGAVLLGTGTAVCDAQTTYQALQVTQFSTTVKYYANTPDEQMNSNGATYYYVAIG